MSPRACATELLAVAALLPATAAVPARAAPGLRATVDRAQISTQVGRSLEFGSTITNPGPGAATGLVAHLSVLSLRKHPYVDPEDWSPARVVFLDPIPAGDSRTLRWPMKAVDAGTFGVYVSILSKDPSDAPSLNTPTIDLRVTERRTLNAGGILPLACAIPGLLGCMAIAVRVRRRAARPMRA